MAVNGALGDEMAATPYLQGTSAWVHCREGKSGDIELMDDSPDVVEAMVRFFYTFDYQDFAPSPSGLSPTVFHVKIFAAAEKYFVEQLQVLAAKKLADTAKRDWGTDGFADAIQGSYTSTSDSERRLRDPLIAVVKDHVTDLYATSGKYKKFLELSTKLPEF
ncbi:hypothetical protein LTR36_005393 [Oleoguttula mirabilis]|uniref:BTB domain-containing protein n=1 Tax=Oleoguttula mirabilis TaxID=1507867 RepID=A0AAV9JF99_9PEZI|nr:hypothetical protein LTR36_005393 [Oleoguttula mirabilis]